MFNLFTHSVERFKYYLWDRMLQAFGELQQKMVETSQKLKLADIQIETHKRSMTHAQLTEKEISQLPLEVNTYESLGRMFVLKESTETRKNLENKIKMCEEKIKTLEVSLPKQYYSNSSI